MFPFAPSFEPHTRPPRSVRAAPHLVLALLVLLAGLLVACNEDQIDSVPEAQGGSGAGIYGNWMFCDGSATPDSGDFVTFSPKGIFSETLYAYSSTGGVCNAGASVVFSGAGTFKLGGAVPADFAGNTVVATAVDFMIPPSATNYQIIYVDTSKSPNRLYPGDLSGAKDGSTPALRPDTITTQYRYLRQ